MGERARRKKGYRELSSTYQNLFHAPPGTGLTASTGAVVIKRTKPSLFSALLSFQKRVRGEGGGACGEIGILWPLLGVGGCIALCGLFGIYFGF